MVMGRPVKPQELKKRTGTYRPDRDRGALAVLPAATSVPPAPRGMGRAGKKAWRVYWSLGNAWISPQTDAMLITRLCRAYDEEAQIRDEMAHPRFERVLRTVNGEITNPLIQQLRKIEEQITRYEGLCGFTPSDRARLGMAEVERVSKLDAFLRKKQG